MELLSKLNAYFILVQFQSRGHLCNMKVIFLHSEVYLVSL